jgi:hypothetical protein
LEQVRDAKYERKVSNMLSNNKSLSKEKLNLKSLKEKLNKKGIDSTRAVERISEMQRKKTIHAKNEVSAMEIENNQDSDSNEQNE